MELKDALPDIVGAGKQRNVIIFCDPGKDDAAMLAQIYSDQNTHVLGVVTNGCNAPLNHTTRNALQINELTGRTDIPVYRGASVPAGASTENIPELPFGETGMGASKKIVLPETALTAQPQPGVDFAVETIRKAKPETPVTLVSTGGLTDVYETLDRLDKQTPGALKNIAAVSAMAGVFAKEQANAPWENSYAEYNAIFDPKATAGFLSIADKHKIPVILAPLDATHTVLATQRHSEALRKVGNRVSNTMADIIDDPEQWDKDRFPPEGKNTFIPIHDAMASTALMHPELFTVQQASVRGIADGAEPGKTEIAPGGGNNVYILAVPEERREKLLAAFTEDMKAYGKLRQMSHSARYSPGMGKLLGKGSRTGSPPL